MYLVIIFMYSCVIIMLSKNELYLDINKSYIISKILLYLRV